jgi:hypothetical protein
LRRRDGEGWYCAVIVAFRAVTNKLQELWTPKDACHTASTPDFTDRVPHGRAQLDLGNPFRVLRSSDERPEEAAVRGGDGGDGGDDDGRHPGGQYHKGQRVHEVNRLAQDLLGWPFTEERDDRCDVGREVVVKISPEIRHGDGLPSRDLARPKKTDTRERSGWDGDNQEAWRGSRRVVKGWSAVEESMPRQSRTGQQTRSETSNSLKFRCRGRELW